MPKGVYERTEEAKRKISIGKKNSFKSQIATAKLNASKKGIKLTEEHKRKIGLGGLGQKRSKETKRNISNSLKGKEKSKKHKEHLSFVKIGKPVSWATGVNNWNWKGGITSLKKQIRDSVEYKFWRTSVFKRDNYTCVKCNKRRCYLEADHIIPLYLILKKYFIITLEEARFCQALWDISNGQTLCKECHGEKTSKDIIKLRANEKENIHLQTFLI